jgi:hypothetical protein
VCTCFGVSYFSRAYFIIGLSAVEQAQKRSSIVLRVVVAPKRKWSDRYLGKVA